MTMVSAPMDSDRAKTSKSTAFCRCMSISPLAS